MLCNTLYLPTAAVQLSNLTIANNSLTMTIPEEIACIAEWHCLEVFDDSIAAECAAYTLDSQVHLLVLCHELWSEDVLVRLSTHNDVQC